MIHSSHWTWLRPRPRLAEWRTSPKHRACFVGWIRHGTWRASTRSRSCRHCSERFPSCDAGGASARKGGSGLICLNARRRPSTHSTACCKPRAGEAIATVDASQGGGPTPRAGSMPARGVHEHKKRPAPRCGTGVARGLRGRVPEDHLLRRVVARRGGHVAVDHAELGRCQLDGHVLLAGLL